MSCGWHSRGACTCSRPCADENDNCACAGPGSFCPTGQYGGSAGYNNLNRVFNMTTLRWQPTTGLTVDYSFEYHRYREAQTATQVTSILPGGPVDALLTIPGIATIPNPNSLVPYLRPQREDAVGNNALFQNDVNSLHRSADDGNHRMHLLTAAWDLGEVPWLGSVTLKSISGYRSMSVAQNNDQDGSPARLFETGTSQCVRTFVIRVT